jgi:hypothetical protein
MKPPEYGAQLKPLRDWFVILALLGVLLLVGTLWSAYTFVAVKQGDVVGTAPPVHTPGVTDASIQSVQDLFLQRAAEAEKYQSGSYSFVDPSK